MRSNNNRVHKSKRERFSKIQNRIWDTFSEAEKISLDEVKRKYDEMFEEWKGGTRLVELAIGCHRRAKHYWNNEEKKSFYNDLFVKTRSYGMTHFRGNTLSYFYTTLLAVTREI